MASDFSSQFVEYLRQGKHLTVATGRGDGASPSGAGQRQAKLWELADLSTNAFA